MTAEIEALRNETAALKTQEKSLKTNLMAVSNTMSTAALRAAVSSLQAEKQELADRLFPLRSGDVKPISEEEMSKVEQELKKWSHAVRTRAKIRRDLWTIVRDGCPEGVPLDDFKESLGLEGD
jgi:hypothetical protein